MELLQFMGKYADDTDEDNKTNEYLNFMDFKRKFGKNDMKFEDTYARFIDYKDMPNISPIPPTPLHVPISATVPITILPSPPNSIKTPPTPTSSPYPAFQNTTYSPPFPPFSPENFWGHLNTMPTQMLPPQSPTNMADIATTTEITTEIPTDIYTEEPTNYDTEEMIKNLLKQENTVQETKPKKIKINKPLGRPTKYTSLMKEIEKNNEKYVMRKLVLIDENNKTIDSDDILTLINENISCKSKKIYNNFLFTHNKRKKNLDKMIELNRRTEQYRRNNIQHNIINVQIIVNITTL